MLKERESFLQNYFGTSVTIKKQKKKGKIEIEFLSNEDLDRILELLSTGNHQSDHLDMRWSFYILPVIF